MFLSIIVIVAVGAGFGVGYVVSQSQTASMGQDLLATNVDMQKLKSELEYTNRDLKEAEQDHVAEIKDLQTKLQTSETKSDQLQKIATTANVSSAKDRAELEAKTAELESVVESLENSRAQIIAQQDRLITAETAKAIIDQKFKSIEKALINLENDKNLLVILREDPPTDREEARSHWQRVRNASIETDSSLGHSVDKVLANLDTYFDWADRQPQPNSNAEEILLWYFSFPSDYTDAMRTYETEFYFIIITHVRQASDILQ